MVITCDPNSEMISTSSAPQNGQRGAGVGESGVFSFPTGGHVPLLFQAAQHLEGAGINATCPGAPAQRVPSFPVGLHRRRRDRYPFPETGPEVDDAGGELARLMELVHLSPLWSEPFHRFLECSAHLRIAASLAQPAAPMQVVVVLFLQHLPQPAA